MITYNIIVIPISTCPGSHPNAYGNGMFCCAGSTEKSAPTIHGEDAGRCKGRVLEYTSSCCDGDVTHTCTNPPCINHNGGWTEIYSQTTPSDTFVGCTKFACDLGSGDNFMNFDLLRNANLGEYHFKLVWNNGNMPNNADSRLMNYALEWKQAMNPLMMVDTDANPTSIYWHPDGAGATGRVENSASRYTGAFTSVFTTT
mgnify:CR=1 FL=1